MKKFTIKIMSAGLAIMLLNVVAGAQTPVAVTGTATASNGLPFASGTYTIQLVDSSGNSLSQFSIGGGTNTQTRFSGTLTTAGALAVSLYANTVIYPNSTKWNFTICSQVPVSLVPNPAATATCYSQAISITAAGSISTPLSASAPAYYPCQIWNGSSVVGCGGGGTFTALTGDATSTATGGATTVLGLNGTLLSSLATGILKNTTGTGVPSIAVASDVVGLFSGCTGTQYLGADGACHTSGSGTVNSGTAGQLGYYAATGTAISGLTLGTNLSITGGTLNATSGGSGTVATANQYQLYYSSGSPSGNTATGSTFLLTDAGGDLLSTSTSAEPLILGNGIGTQIQYVGVDAGRASFGTNIPGTGFLNADISGSVNRGIEFSVNNSTLGGNIVGMFDINGDFCLDGTVVSNLCPSNATFEVTAAGAATAASFGTTSNTNAGYAWLAGNNTNPTILANTAGWLGPASSSFTGYACQMPATAPSNSTPYLSCGTPSGGVSTGTWVSGTTSPTSSYYQSPLIGNTAVAFGGSSTQIWGHAFIPQSNVTFGAIYTTSNTADASNFYSVAISDSSGNLICSVTTGSAVPTAATTLVSTCSQSTPTLVAGNVYILLTTGSATIGKLEATVANGANGPFYSTNVTGCTALLGVITGTCSITLTAPVPYTQGIPTFTLH